MTSDDGAARTLRYAAVLAALSLVSAACAGNAADGLEGEGSTSAPVTLETTATATSTTTTTPASTIATTTSTTSTTTTATTTAVPVVKHFARTGENLVLNPSVEGDSEWRVFRGAIYDAEVSSQGTSGSFSVNAPNASVHGTPIPVSPGVTYTLSTHMLDSAWPPGQVSLFAQVVADDGAFVRNIRSSRQAVSAAGEWQEASVVFVPGSGETWVRPVVVRADGADSVANQMWVDDFYIGEGIGFASVPSLKEPFVGRAVKVDGAGRFAVNRGGAWESFVPICVHADNNNPALDWSKYVEQGFNCNMWASSVVHVRAAAEVGMMSCFELAPYALPQGWAFGQLDQLEQRLVEIAGGGLMSSMLCYYLDNENAFGPDGWNMIGAVVETVRRVDPDRPIYVLQGNYGVARAYAAAGLSDVVGTYGSEVGSGGAAGGSRGHVLLEHTPGQVNPVAWVQINLGIGDRFVPTVEAAIADGATAVAFWTDRPPGIETLPWWADLPALVEQLAG